MLRKLFGRRKLVAGLAIIGLTAGLLALTVGVVSAHGGGPGFGGRFRGIDEESLLADELGVTVDELKAARETARDRAAAQALEEGLITQEQYDTMQAMAALRDYMDPHALQAEALGISVDDLADQSLSAWFEELGLDRTTYQTQLQAAYDAALAQAVADGVITQEQADALPACRLPGLRDGHGMRGGRPGGFGGMRQAPGDQLDEGMLNDSGFRGRIEVTPSDEA